MSKEIYGLSPVSEFSHAIWDLASRMEKLEATLPKNKRTPATLPQQILILKHTGILELINSLFKKIKDRNLFISNLLNEDLTNIRKALEIVEFPESRLVTKTNYEFLIKHFKEVGLKQQEEESIKILDTILKKG